VDLRRKVDVMTTMTERWPTLDPLTRRGGLVHRAVATGG
jgi:hypothetical protein